MHAPVSTKPATIREAVPADLDRIVALHVAVWRETYRELAPPEAHRVLDEAARRPQWVQALRDGSTLAATIDGTIMGFAHIAAPSHPALGDRGEIKHLYVDPSRARLGIGRQLLVEARRLLARRGHPAAALGVVVGNEGALRFCEAEGGRVVSRYRDPGPVWPSDNLVVAWDAPPPAG